MTTVQTVCGPIDSADLGFTLMHEHVLVAAGGLSAHYPRLLGPGLVERAVRRLQAAREGGIATLVDATTFDLGRDPQFLAEVSRRSGVNIIACTGWWLDLPRFMGALGADQLASEFVRDIEEGFADTGIRAGIIKSAADRDGVTRELDVMARAAARAQVKTGLPMMIHSFPTGHVGRRQIAILKEEGVDLSRVKMDHSNDTTDTEYLIWMLDQGVWLGLDRYPGGLVSSRARTKTLKSLIDAGYAGRLCPSHDSVPFSVLPQKEDGSYPSEEEAMRRNPHGYLYIHNVVLPELREMGVDEATIRSIFVDNPRRFFEGT